MDTRDKAHKLCFAPFYSLCCRHKISDLIWLKLLWDDLLRLQDDLRFVCTFSVLNYYIYYISCNRSNMLILGTFRITISKWNQMNAMLIPRKFCCLILIPVCRRSFYKYAQSTTKETFATTLIKYSFLTQKKRYKNSKIRIH